MVSSVRKYWILWFAFLAVPGSGFLRFDGIPFCSKTEFAVLAVSVVGALLPTVRLTLKKFEQQGSKKDEYDPLSDYPFACF